MILKFKISHSLKEKSRIKKKKKQKDYYIY